MGSDQVRQASKVLGPLLRRRGTSPALGATLRRALQALDKSFAGLSPQAEDETIETGIAELRACVELIGQSDRPADHEQLAGIERALVLLAPPFAAPPPALALEAPATGVAAAVARVGPTAGQRKPRTRRPGAPALDFETVGTLLLGLEAKLQTLHLGLGEPLFTMADGCAAEAELERQIEALRWLGKERAVELLRVADLAQGLEDRLVAGAALVYLGEGSGAEMVMGILGKAAAAKQPFPEISPTLLRTFTDASVLDWLRQLVLRPAHPAVCGLLLPLLVERNLLSAEQVWSWVNHAKDDVAVAAACALPWIDGRADVESLLAWAREARSPRRAPALLFAATALGSAAALAEVRARLQQDRPSHRLLVDALAVAGGAGDAELLTALAAHPDADAGYLLLAAANLGSAGMLDALPSFADEVPGRILEEVRRMVTGRSSPDGDGPGLDMAVRALRGQPWSVAGVLACLGSPEESPVAQRRMAIELRVRTGQALPSRLPQLLPPAARSGLLATWTAHYAKAGGKLRPGGWYYQGRPA